MQPLQEEEEEEDHHGGGGDGGGGQEKGLEKNFGEAGKENKEGGGLSLALKSLFRCSTCSSPLPPPSPLYQVFLIFHNTETRFTRLVKLET